MAKQANYIFDFRGNISSIALLKTTRIFNNMKPLEILEIVGADSDARGDLLRVLPESSYDIIFLDEAEDGDSICRLQLRKRPGTTEG